MGISNEEINMLRAELNNLWDQHNYWLSEQSWHLNAAQMLGRPMPLWKYVEDFQSPHWARIRELEARLERLEELGRSS